jgi:hypothetical protein
VHKVAWAVAMSTATYGIEAIWKDQKWLLNGFNKITVSITRAVAGTDSTAKGEDAIPPPQHQHQQERLLTDAESTS